MSVSLPVVASVSNVPSIDRYYTEEGFDEYLESISGLSDSIMSELIENNHLPAHIELESTSETAINRWVSANESVGYRLTELERYNTPRVYIVAKMVLGGE